MPIDIKFARGPKKKRNYQLTAKGQSRAEEYNISGNKGQVVAALDRLETGTLSEIANEAKLSKDYSQEHTN